ncbi:MAG: ArsR family transcriptional regulator [Nocardioides sp.]|nr:ArsR family transcriptional regulator [Nocardioides sp.]
MTGPRGDAATSDAGVVHEPRACSVALARAFGFLGKRWNGVILGTLIAGPAGYAALRRALGGISDSVLSARLAELTSAGLLERTVEPGPPLQVRYALSPSGEALVPALRAISDWGSAHLPDDAGC